ncbi:O-antigen ligase domain-containing protein [Faecalicatena contorta]|uniref:O-antigen ligase family protein n=1 Tax=Faecalicatena contorta TaxID=39482 RepID=UPI00129E18A2|nr:O-antigen ligase family protein [Faecalicatena contorta]MRM90595.1 O-antigen ligase domain-containing protein [Faecalicatena contorta]
MTENKIFKQVLFIFKMYYMIYLLLAFNAFVNGTVWMKYATILSAVWGAVLGLWMLKDYRLYLKVPNLWPLAAFLLSAVFSAVMNIRYGYLENIEGLVWMFISLFIIYIPTCTYSREEVLKELKITAVVYVVYCTVVHIISLSMVYWGRNMGYTDPLGTEHIVGFNWGRLWGIYDEPNRGSVIALAAVFLAVYLFWISKRKVGKVFWVFSIIVQFQFLVFSDSRTGEVALATGLFVMAGLCLYRRFGKCRGRAAAAFAAALVIGLAAVAGTVGFKQIYNTVDKKIEAVHKAKKNIPKKSISGRKAIGRKDDLANDLSNGRMGIWESGLEIIKASPVYGTSYRNITEFAEDQFPETYLVKNSLGIKYDSMHSMVVDTATAQGALGIAALIWLMVNTLLYMKRKVKGAAPDIFRPAVAVFTVMASISAAATVLSTIFYVNSPETYCFWLCFGYFIALLQTGHKEEAK